MNIDCHSKRMSARNGGSSRRRSAYTLAEMLVYMGLLFLVVGMAFAAMYRSMDASSALRRNASDIVETLKAGEQWREDVRTVTGPIHLEKTAQSLTLRLPHRQTEIDYLVSTNTVSRRINATDWTPVLDHVKNSDFITDRREKVTAWRWEVELQPSRKRITRVQPLFTFLAVPPANFAQ